MDNIYNSKSFEKIKSNLQKSNLKKTIIFSDGESSDIQDIAKQIISEKLAKKVILIVDNNYSTEPHINSSIIFVSPPSELSQDDLEFLYNRRKQKESKEQIAKCFKLKEYYAALLILKNEADCWIGGLNNSTKAILIPALKYIKVSPNAKICSSAFIMSKNDKEYIFADCALIIEPKKDDYIEIVNNSLEFAKSCNMFDSYNVAMLSFSSFGSGAKEYNEQIIAACDYLNEKNDKNNINIVGEIQFDAAFSKRIFEKKCKDAQIIKKFHNSFFNIFIFPNLFAGNIGYKIAQNMGGYEAIGPFILGINSSVSDLSRGATKQDIYKTAIYTLMMAVNNEK